MLAKILKNFSIAAILLLLVGCGDQQATTPTPETASPTPPVATGKIVIADVSLTPSKKFERFQPMADYLASRLGKFGIGVGEVKIAPDLETVAKLLKTGEVDIYFDSPYPAMIVREMSGAKPILRRWKSNLDSYFGVIFVRADSKINSVKDLQGKMIAFEEPVSTSGYFLQSSYLLNAGLKLAEKKSIEQSISPNEVGYVFSDDDENTIQWVISGRVAAGAADGVIYSQLPEESRKAMKILAKTDKLPRHIVMIKPDMKPEQIAAIKTILVDMDKTDEGKEILNKFEKTAKFDEYPVEADLDKMQKLYDRVKNQ